MDQFLLLQKMCFNDFFLGGGRMEEVESKDLELISVRFQLHWVLVCVCVVEWIKQERYLIILILIILPLREKNNVWINTFQVYSVFRWNAIHKRHKFFQGTQTEGKRRETQVPSIKTKWGNLQKRLSSPMTWRSYLVQTDDATVYWRKQRRTAEHWSPELMIDETVQAADVPTSGTDELKTQYRGEKQYKNSQLWQNGGFRGFWKLTCQWLQDGRLKTNLYL